ncbi:DUF4136 domain-containing protein [Novosphingobium sp. ZN18A2]|uniref:DUF4136 domain-containing protein n=1 Tax=Novosphingobium sp. ZN18A2 TaxID=3079861 RepID=UPI0030CAB8A3
MTSFRTRLIGLAAAPLLIAGLGGCAQNFNAQVQRFQHELPAPAGQTFAVVPEDLANRGGLEFAQYANDVSEEMTKLGYVQGTPETADLIVHFGYGVDNGRDRVRTTGPGYDPFWSPWYRPYGYWGSPGFYRHGAWGYGWYDPWFWGSGFNDVDVITVYTSKIDLKIDRRTDGKRVFEGNAEAASRSNDLTYLVPNLVDAMFTGFPGNSGKTVRITVAPEKKGN